MNRRTAMLLTMLMGGLAPRGLLAQGTTSRRPGTAGRRPRIAALDAEPARPATADDGEVVEPPPAGAEGEDVPSGFPSEPGFQWRTFDISRYTGLDHHQSSPQNAIVEWIFKRTGTAPWHGEKVAVLSASRARIKAYHDPKVLEQVGDVVERFTHATSDFLAIRVRYVAAVDTRWRYAVYSRLTPVGSGPQGQQIWTLKVEDAAFVLAQMQVYQGFRLLADNKIEVANGETLSMKTAEPRGYIGSMQRESAVGLGYQPKAEQLEEGVTLRLSPLLTYDGDALDAAIDLTANTVKSLHRTRVIAPREIGPAEITLDVPEVAESRLSQTVKGWPIGQTLLISAGIQPGILMSKGGFMNLKIPGTVPSGTELLVFLDVETINRNRRASRDRDRDRQRD